MTTIDTRTSKRSGRHPLNIGHFVMGIAFIGIVVIWILIRSDAVTGDDIRWLLPVPWVLAGVAGLLATTRRKHPEVEAYESGQRGWVGQPQPAPRVEEAHHAPAYDDLDERLARAERETRSGATTAAAAPPPEPADPDDPADPADPADPTDPEDPQDPEENEP